MPPLKLDAPRRSWRRAHAGLDAERFRIDLESHATLEAFGSDLEETRDDPDAAREAGLATEGARVGVERLRSRRCLVGGAATSLGRRRPPYEVWRAAATAAGARAEQRGAARTCRRAPPLRAMAGRVEAVCDLPGPRAAAEAWRLAGEWRVGACPVLTGELWELA